MKIEPTEIYSTQSNVAVVRVPGRHFPGVVVQGDTLRRFSISANEVAKALLELGAPDEPRAEMQMLLDDLVGLLMHYQHVLKEHGLKAPILAWIPPTS
jgi:Family of unknown function (DUF6959)